MDIFREEIFEIQIHGEQGWLHRPPDFEVKTRGMEEGDWVNQGQRLTSINPKVVISIIAKWSENFSTMSTSWTSNLHTAPLNYCMSVLIHEL